MMRSSTFINSASHVFRFSSNILQSISFMVAAGLACLLQYSMIKESVSPVTLGKGMVLEAQLSSIIWVIVCDWNAAASSMKKDWPSQLIRLIVFDEDWESGSLERNSFCSYFNNKLEREITCIYNNAKDP